MPDDLILPEENLDPQNWDAFRGLAHKMLDDMLDFQQNVREGPVWQPVPDSVSSKMCCHTPWGIPIPASGDG